MENAEAFFRPVDEISGNNADNNVTGDGQLIILPDGTIVGSFYNPAGPPPPPPGLCGLGMNVRGGTIIGLYKTEVARRRGPWRSVDAVEFATVEWVDWFNNRRLLERQCAAGRVRAGVLC